MTQTLSIMQAIQAEFKTVTATSPAQLQHDLKLHALFGIIK